MSIFSWFKNRNNSQIQQDNDSYLPKNLFVDNDEVPLNNETENMNIFKSVNEIHEQNKIILIRKELDDFLTNDFGPQGYDDALINPDFSNAEAHMNILKIQLEIIIERVLTKLQNEIANFKFHLATRDKNGMYDLAEEIKAEISKYEDEITKIEAILSEDNPIEKRVAKIDANPNEDKKDLTNDEDNKAGNSEPKNEENEKQSNNKVKRKSKGQIVLLSYEQGFKKGLAAITASQLFGKPYKNE